MEPGTAEVWWARREDYHAELAGFFDETELERFARYRRDEDRQRFAVGCSLAKLVVARVTGTAASAVVLDRTCTGCGGKHGKPAVVGTDLELSVSHSGDRVVVAVTRATPCGVDVERLDGHRDIEALGRVVLAGSERADARSERDFLRAWTRKEAVTKATGDGLRIPFSEVVVSGPGEPPRVLAWPYPDPPDSLSLIDLDPPPGYLAALAVRGPVTNVVIRNGDGLLAQSH